MKRRDFLIKSGIAVGAAGILPLVGYADTSEQTRLVILHTNDTHSRLDPFPDDGRKWGGLGGIAKRTSIVTQIKAKEKNVLLLDSGDIVQGTPYFNFFGGEPELKAMSAMGYDATTLGNHEFDNGLPGIEKMLRFAEFPYLISNYDFDKTILKNKFLPYKTLNKGGIKIGIFGLGIAFDGLVLPNQFGQTKWLDPLPIAKQMVTELKNKLGCNYVICLSHLGYTYPDNRVSDKILAKSTPGLDLILGGHTHTFMEQPERILHQDQSETIINQVGWAGIWLGEIVVEFGPKMNPKTTAMAPNIVSDNIRG